MNIKQRAQCEGKARFTSFAKAEIQMQWLIRAEPGGNFNVYHCKYCNHYHIGTKMKEKAA